MKQKKLIWLLSVVTMFIPSYGINIAQQNQRIEEIKADIRSNRLEAAQEKINKLPANLAQGRIIKELESKLDQARKNKQGEIKSVDSSSLIPQVPTPPAFITKQTHPVPSAHDKPEMPSYVKTSADAKAMADKTEDRPDVPTAPEAPSAPLAPSDLPSAGTKPTKAPTKPVSKPKPAQDFNQELLNKIKGRNKDQSTQSDQSPLSKPTTSSASPSPAIAPASVFQSSQAPIAPDAPPLDSADYPSAPQAPAAPEAPSAPLAPSDLPSAGTKPTKAPTKPVSKPKPAQDFNQELLNKIKGRNKDQATQSDQSPSSKPTTNSASPSPAIAPASVFQPSQAPIAPDAPPLDSADYPSAPQAPAAPEAPSAPLAPTDLPLAPTKAPATISAKPNKPVSQSPRSSVMDELNAKLKKRKEQAEQGSITGTGTGTARQQAPVASQGPTQDQQKSQAALAQGLAKIRAQVAPEDEEEND